MALPSVVVAALMVLGSFAVGWAFTWLGVAVALRRLRGADGLPWPERARRAFPARLAVAWNALLGSLILGGLTFLVGGQKLGLSPVPWAVSSGLAGWLGAAAVGQGLEHRLCRPVQPGDGRGVALYWLLHFPGLLPFGLTLALIPSRWGWPAAAALAVGAVVTTLNVRGDALRLLLWADVARPASDRLAGVVARAADRVGVRPAAVYELDSPNANALAWPVPKFLVFTRPLVDAADDDELGAITAHELGHLDEPWGVYLTRIAAAYLPVVLVVGLPLAGSFGLAAGLLPVAGFFAGLVVFQWVGRRMEERADRVGKDHEGCSEGAYAGALEKLHEINLMPVVMPGKRQVHPHLFDRMTAAGRTPDYPRPEPPPSYGWESLLSLALVMVVVALWFLILSPN